jgi:hypothetical protein
MSSHFSGPRRPRSLAHRLRYLPFVLIAAGALMVALGSLSRPVGSRLYGGDASSDAVPGGYPGRGLRKCRWQRGSYRAA